MTRGKIRHVSSRELVSFKEEMRRYFIAQSERLLIARAALQGFPLSIHVDFGFARGRLLTKKGNFKRLDVSNRLKACHDAFSEALGIDDCMFVHVSARKFCVRSAYAEGAQVSISLCDFVEAG